MIKPADLAGFLFERGGACRLLLEISDRQLGNHHAMLSRSDDRQRRDTIETASY
jgi:hypothetical protein